MLKKIFVVGLFISYCSSLLAGSINAQLSNDSARFMYVGGISRLHFEGGVIYESGGSYLGIVGILVTGENADAPVVASLGIRAYGGQVSDDTLPSSTVAVLGLGGDLAFNPVELPGFEFGVHYYIAPNTVSAGDSSKLVDYGLRVGYQVIPLSTVFIGYQSIAIEIDGYGKYILDDGFIIGMNFTF
ncbi:MAG: YfaZ family outer membrane protein [Thiohalomonadales bacterium]